MKKMASVSAGFWVSAVARTQSRFQLARSRNNGRLYTYSALSWPRSALTGKAPFGHHVNGDGEPLTTLTT